MSNSLPSTWAIVSLLDVAPLVPTGVPNFTGEVEYYSTGSVQEGGLSSEGRYTFESRPSRANRWTKPGDVLQARMQGTSKPLLVHASIADKLFSTGFIQLRPDPRFCNPGFLRHYIASKVFLDDRDSLATGSTQIALTDAGVRGLEIPLAPLNEQRRIVAKLEKLLAKVDACQHRLGKIPVLLKRFRQSVLAAACSGLLTEDWRGKNSDVQPPAVEDEGDGTPYELPYGWKQARLGALASLVTSGSRGWAKYYADSGSIFIRAQDINSDALDLDNVAHVRLPNRVEGQRTRVQQHDILVTITGANVAKSALVNQILKDAYINQHVALVRLLDTPLSQFLYLWIVSPVHGRKQWLDDAYGQGKPGLNLDNIRGLFVGLPPFTEQQEIVRRVEAMYAVADQIEARFVKAKTRVDQLTQSLLAKAFRGELVPTEAELARREGRSYETASELLARIKSERESKGVSERVRRNRNF